MKLKEYPPSLYRTLRLASKPIKQFQLDDKEEVPVVVSLTSISSRLPKLHIVIRGLFDQSVKPKKIILWLHESLKNQIPEKLQQLVGDLFNIHYTHLHVSHKKLIHTIPLYPETAIVTCDDDFIYRKNWLELLYHEHVAFPNSVIANHVRTISYDDSGKLLSYKKWVYNEVEHVGSHNLLAIGGKGVLYPPNTLHNTLHKTFSDEPLFMKLAPKADDLWFKAMELLQGTHVKLSGNPAAEPIPIAGTQKISLKKENVDDDKNRSQWEALDNYFNFKERFLN